MIHKEAHKVLYIPHGKASITEWLLEGIRLVHGVTTYEGRGSLHYSNDQDFINLHFNLGGKYTFSYKQLGQSFEIAKGFHNIMFSKGFEMTVENHDLQTETFGIQFEKDYFLQLVAHSNDTLKKFADNVLQDQNAILSQQWGIMDHKLHLAIEEVLNCQYIGGMKDLFLLSKSIEILVLQAEAFERNAKVVADKDSDSIKESLLAAKEFVQERIHSPPSLAEVAKAVGLNEYKLKKGFKEKFNTTVYGYLTEIRLNKARELLLEKTLTASEIAYELGYSSPQHFNTAFKRKFGVSPKKFA